MKRQAKGKVRFITFFDIFSPIEIMNLFIFLSNLNNLSSNKQVFIILNLISPKYQGVPIKIAERTATQLAICTRIRFFWKAEYISILGN